MITKILGKMFQIIFSFGGIFILLYGAAYERPIALIVGTLMITIFIFLMQD